MQEKHGKSKETDITGVLVVILVLMTGILIAKVSENFVTQKTSSSTRAAQPKKFKNTVVKAPVKTLSSHVAYGDVTSCPIGQKSWFGVCVAVNNPECADSCSPNKTVADKTSYGNETCSETTRCLPISVKSQFTFNPSSEASSFCEKVTGTKGATCYSNKTESTVKDISLYKRFVTGENISNSGYFQKQYSLFGMSFGNYQIECPVYTTYVGGGVDMFASVFSIPVASVDNINSGYCYIPKTETL